jgi:quinol monooxygenase YgiN
MAKLALFITAKAKPGKRDELRRLWEEHIKPHSESNQAQEYGCYAFATEDENTICLFELFSDPSVVKTDMESDWFAAYMEKVRPLMAEPSQIVTAVPLWIK